ALFYPGDGRYHYLTWLLTLLVVAAWVHGEGLDIVRRRFPHFSARVAKHPASLALARGLARMSEMLERYGGGDARCAPASPPFIPAHSASKTRVNALMLGIQKAGSPLSRGRTERNLAWREFTTACGRFRSR